MVQKAILITSAMLAAGATATPVGKPNGYLELMKREVAAKNCDGDVGTGNYVLLPESCTTNEDCVNNQVYCTGDDYMKGSITGATCTNGQCDKGTLTCNTGNWETDTANGWCFCPAGNSIDGGKCEKNSVCVVS